MSKLTAKQALFIDKYFIYNMNATRAYMDVYKPKDEATARANSSRMLTNANIKEEIKIRLDEVKKAYIISPQHILEELAYTAFRRQDIEKIQNVEIEEEKVDIATGKIYTEKKIVQKKTVKTFDELTEADKACIDRYDLNKDGTIKVIYNDKLKALDLLGKYHGLWEKQNETVSTMDTSSIKEFTKEEMEAILLGKEDK